MSWTDNVFSNEFSEDGTPVPQRKRVDFVGATVEDVPAEDLTRITITGGGGADLSDSPARSVAESSAAGTSAQASRADHVHAHGSLPGGSLHAVAVASVAGVGGSAGFASPVDKERTDQVPQMLLDIAALPSTYAPIVHTHAHSSLTGLTTGDPHTQYVLRTDGDVVGNSNKYLIRDAQARAQARGLVNTSNSTPAELFGANNVEVTAGTNPSNTTAGVVITARGGGIKLQVNDSVTPATVRTPFQIIREEGGVGTADRVYVDADFGVLGIGAWLNVKMASGRFTFDWTDDDNAMSAYWDHVNGFLFAGAPINLGSTATAGQIRVIDGEILNAKGSSGAEVCLVSYALAQTRAMFGSSPDGRTAPVAWLVGSTEAVLVADAKLQVRAQTDQVKLATQLANGVNAVAASTSTTTIDCSKGNVHKVTVTAATTIELTNTKAGAQYRIYFELSGSTSYTVTLGTASFDGTYNPSANAPGLLDTYPLTSSLAHGGLICEPFADGGKAFVTRQWTTP